MLTIGLLNQKGGVGKTTVALSIAHELTLRFEKKRVLVVDVDPQQSAVSWSEARDTRPPFNVIGLVRKSLHRDLPAIAEGYDFVIIDGPPRTTDLARSCIMASDLVLIPCTPSPYDVWASEDTVALVREVEIIREDIKCAFVMNKVTPNTAIGREIPSVLKQFDFPILTPAITQRVIFAETAAIGLTVFDIASEGKGAAEVKQLVNAVLEYSFKRGER